MRTCTEPGCNRKHQARGYCGSHYNQHYAKPSQVPVPCTVCGTMAMKDKRDHAKRRPVCSDMCRTYLTHGHWPMCMVSDGRPAKRRARAIAKLEASMTLPSSRKRWYAGRCKRCGAWFIQDDPQGNWCSETCLRRGYRARRRSLQRQAFVEDVRPLEIFTRDGWRCKLCGRAVARTKMVPHPRAPVLDHVVPLARGGLHERANVQCAHFMCNSVKGDRAANDQLMLFG